MSLVIYAPNDHRSAGNHANLLYVFFDRRLLVNATCRTSVEVRNVLDMCERIIDEYADSDLESFDTSALLSEITTMLTDNGFDLDPFLTSFARALITIEGTVKVLSPRVLGVPAIGFAGFVMGFVLMVQVLWGLHKSKKR